MEQNSNELAKKVVDTILQNTNEVVVGDDVYTIAPPSTATLMIVSSLIKRHATVKPDKKEDLWQTVLSYADETEWIGEVVATLILGAKQINKEVEKEKKVERKYLFGLIKRSKVEEKKVKLKDKLKWQILNEYSPMEVSVLLSYLLSGMQLDHFFELTTFLSEINLMRRTREVESETTASGQQ